MLRQYPCSYAVILPVSSVAPYIRLYWGLGGLIQAEVISVRVRGLLSELGKGAFISSLMGTSWVIVFSTNGTSEAYVYCFFIPVVLGARFWGSIGGIVTGIVAGVAAGVLMPLSVHPFESQSTSNWLVRLSVMVIVGYLVGRAVAQMKERNDKIQHQNRQLQEFGSEVIHALAHAIALRDPYTNDHCQRVARISRMIGEKMGLSEEDLLYLYWSALVHDIGKISIPESILTKPGRLTNYEYGVVKQHPILGDWVLSELKYGYRIRDGVLTHHERWDGTGYPAGLKGEAIPIQGRIIAVADVWDSLTRDRPYRDRLPEEQCLRIMREGRGTQFDPVVLNVFLNVVLPQINVV